MRRLGSLLVLLALLGGPPALLLRLGFYDWGGLNPWAPADYRLLLGVLTLAAWAAWLVFVAAVVAEAIGLATGGRVRLRLPGPAAPQSLAAALLAGLLVAGAPAGLAAAAPSPDPVAASTRTLPAPPAAGGGTVAPDALPAAPAAGLAVPGLPGTVLPGATATAPPVRGAVSAADDAIVHVVDRSDDLWSLAERYYGSGTEWRRIVRANPDLAADPTADLAVGTALAIVDPLGDYRIERGDTLWHLAEERLGDGARYPELQRLNADRITDPDYIEAGWTIRLPGDPQPDAEAEPPTAAEAAPAAHPAAAPTPAASIEPAASTGPASTGPVAPVESVAPQPDAAPAAEPDAAPLDSVAVRGVLGGLAALAASGVLGGLLARRRERAASRQVGRTFGDPEPELQRLETALGLSGLAPAAAPADEADEPATGETAGPAPSREHLVARAQRLLAAQWWAAGRPVPALRRALVAEDAVSFEFAEPETTPAPFEATADPRCVRASWAALASATEPEHPVAYPAAVTLGRDAAGDLVLIDLAGWGLLSLEGGERIPAASLSAMLVELACSPWAAEVTLWAVVADRTFVDVAAGDRVRCFPDVEGAVRELERHAADRRALLTLTGADYGRLRLDPDTADAWAPIVLLLEQAPDAAHLDRLRAAIAAGAGLAVVVAADIVADAAAAPPPAPTAAPVDAPLPEGAPASGPAPVPEDAPASGPAPVPGPTATGRLVLTRPGGGAAATAVLEPAGISVAAQTLDPGARDAIAALYAAAEDEASQPAPWWAEEGEGAPAEPALDRTTLRALRVVRGPRLRLFGRVRLEGASGAPPEKAQRRCLEYCAWLLEHPGATASEMTRALFVTDGTRRSNLSRLRAWLGPAADGELYLPEAYAGRIELHPAVTSDWQELQRLLARGVNRTPPERLRAALALVDGAPLADAAPGEWAWADGLRTRMGEAVRDLVVTLARADRERGDLDAARDACARGRLVVGEDELLGGELMRVEAAAGDLDAARAVLLGLERAARDAGVDLRPETVALGQEIVEGRLRAQRRDVPLSALA